MAVTPVVDNVTRVDGETLSVAVQLPDGSFQRYTVSLLDPNIKSSLEAKARQTAGAANDARIKANLLLVMKGLVLDLSEPVVAPPVTLPQSDVDFIADYQRLKRYTSPSGVAPKGVNVAALRQSIQARLDADDALEKYVF